MKSLQMTTQNHKFKLTLLGLVMQGMGMMAHAACGVATQTGTDYTISTNITNSATNCDLPTNATSLTISNGAGLSTDSTVMAYGVRVLSGNTAFSSLSNSGTLSAQYPLVVSSSIQSIANNTGALITGTSTVIQVDSSSTVTNFLNNGSITGTSFFSDAIQNYGNIIYLENNGVITSFDSAFVLGRSGINNGGQIGQIVNNSSLASDTYGIQNSGTITTLTNNANGTISGGSNGIINSGTINTITNLGTITGAYGGIFNDLGGVITTLSNAQSGLTYVGLLPTNYKIIITSTGYGTLDGTGQSSGSTTFGISSLSTLRAGSFSNVLTGGFSPSAGLANSTASTGVVTGTQGGYNWTLTYSASTTSWNLDLVQGTVTPSGPTAADTQESLTQAASALRSVFNQQTAVSNNSLNYDCTVFAENGVCVSAGGRFATSNSITGEKVSTLLVASYKAMKNVRLGGFIDQNTANPSVTGVSMDKAPMYGVFGVWNQNPDLMGYEVRLSSNWSDQNITQTRNVVGTSEAGVGTASLKTKAISGVVSYAMPVTDSTWIASPYVGVRKTKVSRGGYTETSAVTTPLTFSDLSQDITTALAGVRMNKKFNDNVYLTGSVGVEQNVGSTISTLDASGVTGLTATDFSANYAKTRPVASAGASYAIDKNQRVSLSAMYRKEAFQSSGSTTALLMYQVGL